MWLEQLSSWEIRLRRAELLEEKYPFAREYLDFYKEILIFQRRLYYRVDETLRDLPWRVGQRPLPEPWIDHHWSLLVDHFPPFLQLIERIGPETLVGLARALLSSPPSWWETLVKAYWKKEDMKDFEENPPLVFFPRAFLQPYAEFLADRYRERFLTEDHWEVAHGGNARCPLCASKPQVSILRREAEGAKRLLQCSLCAHEWRYKRISCPACGEEDHAKLGYYWSEEFPYIRVEVCDTCQVYIKGIDMTRQGLAVPVVDEIVSIPLDVWAVENQYRKIELNILGI